MEVDDDVRRLFAARAARAASGWRVAPAVRGAKTKRPTAAARRQQMLNDKSILDGVCGVGADGKLHKCKNEWVGTSGQRRCCSHELYSNVFIDARYKLRTQRTNVLNLSQRARGRLAFAAMHRTAAEGAAFDTTDVDVKLQVGSRSVCEVIFLSHFCISAFVLQMLKVRCPPPAHDLVCFTYTVYAQKCLREGSQPYLRENLGGADTRPAASRTLIIIAWWKKYAEETAERLPDTKTLMTPCRQMACRSSSMRSHSLLTVLLPV